MIWEPPRLRVHMATTHRCPPEWRWDSADNRWTGLLLWLVLDGRARLHAPDRRHDLKPGDCFVLRMRERHLGVHRPERPLVVQGVHFHVLDSSGREHDPSVDELPRHRRVTDVALLAGLVDRLGEAYAVERGDGGPETRLWLAAVLAEVVRQDHLAAAAAVAQDDAVAAAIAAWCARLREDPASRLGVADLARAAGVGVDHAIRRFRRQLGCTPIAWQMRVRIDAAKHLLRCSSLGVGAIAARLGYADAAFFSRQFTRVAGLSPRRFRAGAP